LGILGEKSRILDFLGRILELFWRSSGKNFRPFFGNNVLKPTGTLPTGLWRDSYGELSFLLAKVYV